MAHRTFASNAPTENGEAPAELEPVGFTLEGHPPQSKLEWSEAFSAVPIAPGGVLDDIAASVRIDARGRRTYDAPSLMRFMRGVLIDADVDRFEDLMRDKDRVVRIETLGEVVIWLTEELTGRPTTPPSS